MQTDAQTQTNPCANPACKRPARKKYCEQPCAARHIALRRAGSRPSDLTQTEWEFAHQMLCELQESEGLRVSTWKDEDGRYLRRVDSQNPTWYSSFCSEHQRTKMRRWRNGKTVRVSRNTHKNHHTFVDRRRTLSALRQIVHDSLIVGEYGNRITRFIRRKCAALNVCNYTEGMPF